MPVLQGAAVHPERLHEDASFVIGVPLMVSPLGCATCLQCICELLFCQLPGSRQPQSRAKSWTPASAVKYAARAFFGLVGFSGSWGLFFVWGFLLFGFPSALSPVHYFCC